MSRDHGPSPINATPCGRVSLPEAANRNVATGKRPRGSAGAACPRVQIRRKGTCQRLPSSESRPLKGILVHARTRPFRAGPFAPGRRAGTPSARALPRAESDRRSFEWERSAAAGGSKLLLYHQRGS